MTTVILTPTHIASDHSRFVLNTSKEVLVDLQHEKIFVDPDRKFILAVEGVFNATVISASESMKTLYKIAGYLRSEYKGKWFECDNDEVLDYFRSILEPDTRSLLITKDLRLCIKLNKDNVKVTECGEYIGLGSGGSYATGLLLGGRSIFEIWEDIPRMDNFSSTEHTIISTDILQDF